MFAFAIRMIKDKYRTFVIYLIAAVGFVEMYIGLFPTIKQQSGSFDEMLKAFPPELFKAMNIDPSSLSFGNLESYMSSEFLSFLWPILAIIFAISLANYISVNDIDKGTIELVDSLPVNRTRVIIERYLTGLGLLFAFTFISIMSIVALASIQNTDFVWANYVTTSFGSFLFVWAVYSLAVVSSVIFSEKGKATMITGGVLILMYVVNIIAALNDSLANLKYLSFFEYFNGSDLLANNTFPEYSIPVFVTFSLLSVILAAHWYNKRDLSV